MDHNINLAECIVKQAGWGETIITNICSGNSQTLQRQLGDWAATLILGGVVVFVLVVVAFFIAMIRS